MVIKGSTEDNDVVQEWVADFVPEITKAVLHEPLESCRCVGETKWNANPFVESPGVMKAFKGWLSVLMKF